MSASDPPPTQLYPSPVYAGVPLDDRGPRPSIPKSHRRTTSTQSRANKENMVQQANALRDQFNANITKLAEETNLPRSTVAAEAYKKGKRHIHRRALNPFNAWMALKYAEATDGTYSSLIVEVVDSNLLYRSLSETAAFLYRLHESSQG